MAKYIGVTQYEPVDIQNEGEWSVGHLPGRLFVLKQK